MHLYLIVTFIQVFAAVHALRNGYGCQMVMIILFFPIIGPLVYLMFEKGPSLSYSVERFCKKYQAKKDTPYKKLMRLKAEISKMPTVDRQRQLAMLYMELGQYEQAYTMINSLLHKPFDNDPLLLLDKAEILVKQQEYHQALDIFTHLINENSHRSLCARGKALHQQTQTALGIN